MAKSMPLRKLQGLAPENKSGKVESSYKPKKPKKQPKKKK